MAEEINRQELREAQVGLASGLTPLEVSRKLGARECRGLMWNEARHLMKLEHANARLKKLADRLSLDIAMMEAQGGH